MRKDKNLSRFHAGSFNIVDRRLALLDVSSEPLGLLQSIYLNKLFFYFLQQFKISESICIDECIQHEKGVGYLEKSNNEIFLRRVTSFEYYDGQVKKIPDNNTFSTFYEKDYIVLSSCVPENYVDSYILPHSILCSIEPNIPGPVHLEESTLLGRLDGRIQSIDRGELREIMGPMIIPEESEDQEGSIRWNSVKKCFEGFNGKKWKKIRWENDSA